MKRRTPAVFRKTPCARETGRGVLCFCDSSKLVLIIAFMQLQCFNKISLKKGAQVSNNARVAQAILNEARSGKPFTIRAVTEASGEDYHNVQIFMQRWRVLGWLTAEKHGRALLYSVTKEGAAGLAKLIADDEDNDHRGENIPFRYW